MMYLSLKVSFIFANSVDLCAAFHLGLHCLLKYLFTWIQNEKGYKNYLKLVIFILLISEFWTESTIPDYRSQQQKVDLGCFELLRRGGHHIRAAILEISWLLYFFQYKIRSTYLMINIWTTNLVLPQTLKKQTGIIYNIAISFLLSFCPSIILVSKISI